MVRLFHIFAVILIFFHFSAFCQDNTKYKIDKIVIDPGHGGKDPGAVGKTSYEKDITLAIAMLLGEYIEEYIEDVEVIYTRKTDVFVELKERAEIANSNDADLMISIHVNSSKKKDPYGTSTYVMGLHKTEENLEVAKTENSSIYIESNYKSDYNGFDPDSPEAYIILNLYQNIYLDNSLMLAEKIQSQLREKAMRKDLGVKQAGLVVLWYTTMPSVLVETGFMSNTSEEKYLSTEYGQSIIASAIFRAFREYKLEIEKHSDFSSVVHLNNTDTISTIQLSDNETNAGTEQDEIIFKVQVKSSTVRIPITSDNFKNLNDVSEFIYNGVYKYTVGNTSDYDEILELQTEVKKIVADAFVIAFVNGEKKSVSEALEAQQK